VLEAVNLQADLQRAGIQPWAWIVNQSLAAAHPRSPLLQRRALNERPQLEEVRHQARGTLRGGRAAARRTRRRRASAGID